MLAPERGHIGLPFGELGTRVPIGSQGLDVRDRDQDQNGGADPA